jgi:predicted Holliday junction resolvase-like endonuclease
MNYALGFVVALFAAIVFAALYFTSLQSVAAVRRDAIERSRAVTVGKVTEQIAPWLPDFPFNPKDARFIGSPIDMIVFDGCDDGDVTRVVFVEIKTQGAALSLRQRQIRDAVLAGKVEWLEYRARS